MQTLAGGRWWSGTEGGLRPILDGARRGTGYVTRGPKVEAAGLCRGETGGGAREDVARADLTTACRALADLTTRRQTSPLPTIVARHVLTISTLGRTLRAREAIKRVLPPIR